MSDVKISIHGLIVKNIFELISISPSRKKAFFNNASNQLDRKGSRGQRYAGSYS
jgi:hypothetical protein